MQYGSLSPQNNVKIRQISKFQVKSTQDKQTQNFTSQTTLIITLKSWLFQVSKIKQKCPLLHYFIPTLPLVSLHICKLLFSLHIDLHFAFHYIFLIVLPRPDTLGEHLPSLLLIPLLTFVEIFPSESSWTSSGAVGNWRVNLNVPFPGHTNSWFFLSRTFCRTEILKRRRRRRRRSQLSINLYSQKLFHDFYRLCHHQAIVWSVSQERSCVVKRGKDWQTDLDLNSIFKLFFFKLQHVQKSQSSCILINN